MTRIPSSGTCSVSAQTCANTVSWPCPELVEPTYTFEHPVRREANPGLLFHAAGAALDERSKADAMVPAVDVAALDGTLFGPADLRECALENGAEIAGIELRGRFVA